MVTAEWQIEATDRQWIGEVRQRTRAGNCTLRENGYGHNGMRRRIRHAVVSDLALRRPSSERFGEIDA